MEKSDNGIPPKKRKMLVYGIVGLIGLFLLYHSFYAVPLDSRAKDVADGDMEKVVAAYFSQTLPTTLAQAPEPCGLLKTLSAEENRSWTQYGKQTNIGSRYYFLIKGEGVISEIEKDFINVAFGEGAETCSLRISTVYIFGNEIRDASGKLLLQDVGELSKFNAISELINKKVRDEVVPEFLKQAQVGKKVQVDGAFALNKRIGVSKDFEVVPIQLQVID
ncbi:DUF2291 family protein [Sphingobacterium chuzhouense]|uniref:DUF2291 family protein n=1 Tax=Sphingobacterium chuzhouense TaxID=1742264 RepID=A0ABR7XMY6_9SPHI|nr:DUF2291 family protein [Sphingobacterium chuzhouense]MBD1420538.1 DUF2291 family protein [Sphingobacterium chuzhouense]